VDLAVSKPTPRLLLVLADLVPPRIEDQLTRQIGQEFDNLPPFVDPLHGPVARAVGERLDDLLPLLGHAEAPVRLIVARLLAGLPDQAELTVPTLRDAADREPDPTARASIVLAVGALAAAAQGGPQVLPWLRQVAAEGVQSSDGAALIHAAAAVSVG
jgi:hypothetical protein